MSHWLLPVCGGVMGMYRVSWMGRVRGMIRVSWEVWEVWGWCVLQLTNANGNRIVIMILCVFIVWGLGV